MSTGYYHFDVLIERNKFETLSSQERENYLRFHNTAYVDTEIEKNTVIELFKREVKRLIKHFNII